MKFQYLKILKLVINYCIILVLNTVKNACKQQIRPHCSIKSRSLLPYVINQMLIDLTIIFISLLKHKTKESIATAAALGRCHYMYSSNLYTCTYSNK